jgi:Winged helix-turn-helix domain (DUF2582)
MHEEIGKAAGEIWHALDSTGELSLAQLKKDVKGRTRLFDWAVGWLAREDKFLWQFLWWIAIVAILDGSAEQRRRDVCPKLYHSRAGGDRSTIPRFKLFLR